MRLIGSHIGHTFGHWINKRLYDICTIYRYITMPENCRDGVRMFVGMVHDAPPNLTEQIFKVTVYIEGECAGMGTLSPVDESGDPWPPAQPWTLSTATSTTTASSGTTHYWRLGCAA